MRSIRKTINGRKIKLVPSTLADVHRRWTEWEDAQREREDSIACTRGWHVGGYHDEKAREIVVAQDVPPIDEYTAWMHEATHEWFPWMSEDLVTRYCQWQARFTCVDLAPLVIRAIESQQRK